MGVRNMRVVTSGRTGKTTAHRKINKMHENDRNAVKVSFISSPEFDSAVLRMKEKNYAEVGDDLKEISDKSIEKLHRILHARSAGA